MGCPNSTFTADTHTTRITRINTITLRQQQHQLQLLPVQGSRRPVWETPPSLPLPLTLPQLPASPILPGTVTQTHRMRPFPSQAQRLAAADVSPCPCSTSCFEHGGSGQDPGRLGASRDAAWRLGMRCPCRPQDDGRGFLWPSPGTCPAPQKHVRGRQGKKIRLMLQLASYRPGQVWANGTVPAARWVAPRLLLSEEVREKGTPQRDALAQHPLLRPGPRPGAGRSWPALHGAATRARARKQLQAGGHPGKGRRVLCQ